MSLLERGNCRIVNRRAAEMDVRRCPEPIKEARLAPAAPSGCPEECRGLDAALVARKSNEWHGYFRVLRRPPLRTAPRRAARGRSLFFLAGRAARLGLALRLCLAGRGGGRLASLAFAGFAGTFLTTGVLCTSVKRIWSPIG
jgi:hypothetical protein